MQNKASITENTLTKVHALMCCPTAAADFHLTSQFEWPLFCVTSALAFPILFYKPLIQDVIDSIIRWCSAVSEVCDSQTRCGCFLKGVPIQTSRMEQRVWMTQKGVWRFLCLLASVIWEQVWHFRLEVGEGRGIKGVYGALVECYLSTLLV